MAGNKNNSLAGNIWRQILNFKKQFTGGFANKPPLEKLFQTQQI
jgi:hypothetical protein